MQHKFGPEAVDKTCQDIRNDTRPFGGMTVVFGGIFSRFSQSFRKDLARWWLARACSDRTFGPIDGPTSQAEHEVGA